MTMEKIWILDELRPYGVTPYAGKSICFCGDDSDNNASDDNNPSGDPNTNNPPPPPPPPDDDDDDDSGEDDDYSDESDDSFEGMSDDEISEMINSAMEDTGSVEASSSENNTFVDESGNIFVRTNDGEVVQIGSGDSFNTITTGQVEQLNPNEFINYEQTGDVTVDDNGNIIAYDGTPVGSTTIASDGTVLKLQSDGTFKKAYQDPANPSEFINYDAEDYIGTGWSQNDDGTWGYNPQNDTKNQNIPDPNESLNKKDNNNNNLNLTGTRTGDTPLSYTDQLRAIQTAFDDALTEDYYGGLRQSYLDKFTPGLNDAYDNALRAIYQGFKAQGRITSDELARRRQPLDTAKTQELTDLGAAADNFVTAQKSDAVNRKTDLVNTLQGLTTQEEINAFQPEVFGDDLAKTPAYGDAPSFLDAFTQVDYDPGANPVQFTRPELKTGRFTPRQNFTTTRVRTTGGSGSSRVI